MDATRMTIGSSEDLARLRRQVLYGLSIDSIKPTEVFLCVQCGTVIGFIDNTQVLNVRDVDCPHCGTFNTLQAA